MPILRETFYGTTRFDDFVRRTKISDAIVAHGDWADPQRG